MTGWPLGRWSDSVMKVVADVPGNSDGDLGAGAG